MDRTYNRSIGENFKRKLTMEFEIKISEDINESYFIIYLNIVTPKLQKIIGK